MLMLLSASNNDKKPKIENLVILLEDIENKKDRNIAIAKAYKQGYSQHKIAKV
jgi:hypothetical protein